MPAVALVAGFVLRRARRRIMSQRGLTTGHGSSAMLLPSPSRAPEINVVRPGWIVQKEECTDFLRLPYLRKKSSTLSSCRSCVTYASTPHVFRSVRSGQLLTHRTELC